MLMPTIFIFFVCRRSKSPHRSGWLWTPIDLYCSFNDRHYMGWHWTPLWF